MTRRWRDGFRGGAWLALGACALPAVAWLAGGPFAAAGVLSLAGVAGGTWLLVEATRVRPLRRRLETVRDDLAAMAEASGAVTWEVDVVKGAARPSSLWLTYTGQDVEQAGSEAWKDAVHPDDVAAVDAAWRRARESGTPFRWEYRVWHAATRAWRWNNERIIPVHDDAGRIRRWIGVLLDVDERRRAEDALRDSEQRYRRLVENSGEGIWFIEYDPPIPLDLDEQEFAHRFEGGGRVVECNDAFARCFGYERAEQAVGLSNADMLEPGHPSTLEIVRGIRRGDLVVPRCESIEIDRHGRRRVIDSSVTAIYSDGALVAEWGIQRDVTEEHVARQALDIERQRFQAVLDTLPVGISVKDTEGNYLYMNRAQLDRIGWQDEGCAGRSTGDLPDSAHALRVRQLEADLLAHGEPVRNFADVTEYLPGDPHNVLLCKSLLHDTDGRVSGIATCEFDVTELEAARDALSRSERRWRRVFEALPVALELFDANGNFIEGNPASYEVFGTPRPDARQINMFGAGSVLGPRDRADLSAGRIVKWQGWYNIAGLAAQGIDIRGRTDSFYLNMQVTAVSETSDGGFNYIVISVDETERRAIEEAMRESESRYRRFLDNSHEGIFRIEFDPPVALDLPLEEQVQRYYTGARLAECNDALAQQHGYADSAALVDTLGSDLSRLVAGDCAAAFFEAGCRHRDALITTRHRDGSQVLLRVNAVGEVVDGMLVREWGVGQDVTRDTLAERERVQQQALLATMLESVPLGITVKDAQGRFTYVNRWMCDLAGLEPEQMLGRRLVDLGVTPHAAEIEALDRDVLATGKPAPEHRSRMLHAGRGELLDLAELKAPILDEQQRPIGVVTSLMDVSPIEKARRALEEERGLLQAILDTAPISITLKDENARYRYVNARAREVSRWGAQTIEGRTAKDVDNPVYAADVLALDRRVLETGEASLGVEVGGVDPASGELSVLKLHKTPLRDASGHITGLVSCTLDVSESKRAEQALESQRALFASVLDALPIGVSLRDSERRFRYVNQWWRERFGFDPARQSGLTVEEIIAVGEDTDMETLDQDVLDSGQEMTDIEARIYAADDRDPRYGLVSKLPLRDAAGAVEGIITCTVDITERRRAERMLAQSEQRYRLLYDDNPSMFFTIDEHGTLLQVNEFGARQLGYRVEELVGRAVESLHDDEERELMRDNIAACLADPQRMHRWEIRRLRREGEPLWIRETARAVTGSSGRPVVLTVCEDISEARSLSQELSWQASHDALTGLVNRREFEHRLALALEAARGTGEEHTLCYLDLDQFKVINDTCGHVAGDELLRQLGALFHSRIRRKDTLARLGGDEFGLLMVDCGLEAGERVCRTLRDALDEFRFPWEGNSFRVGSSMGLVQLDAATGAVSELLGAADAACYAAKERGPNRIHVYRRDDAELVRRRGEMQWVSRIERALAEDRLSLAFQPIRALGDTDVGEHYELLLRMRDEEGRPVSPGDFLPAAERYGLATRLDRFVVQTAAHWLGANPAHLDNLFLCCINLSGRTLSAEDFAEFVSHTFAEADVPLDRICFEITETAAIANLAHATRFIEDLHRQGCRFALDDFGSGLSSFAYLKRLPVDFLKIDGMFVRDIAEDPIDLAMVRSISEIGHVMGKRTIAEFVESEVVLERLRELGVDYGQGYHLARPAPLDEMLRESGRRTVSR